jgi:hypothetical protein
MDKIDFKKQFKELYGAKAKPAIVDVPMLNFAMVDGEGDPNTAPAFPQAVEALYAISYTIKFMLKKAGEFPDWTVPPLEGLWWVGGEDAFDFSVKDNWKWTLMIMQPKFVTRKIFNDGLELAKKKKELPALWNMRLEKWKEGKGAQILHVGPYSAEQPTIAALHTFIQAEGFVPSGKHHEIYLGDPRKTAPEKLKTILRQGVGKG